MNRSVCSLRSNLRLCVFALSSAVGAGFPANTCVDCANSAVKRTEALIRKLRPGLSSPPDGDVLRRVFCGGVTKTIQRIEGAIIVLNDSSVWEAGHLVTDLSTWSHGDPIEITGPRSWTKMKNTKTHDIIIVTASRLPAVFPAR